MSSIAVTQCSQCGESNIPTAAFCGGCGAKMSAAPATPYSIPAAAPAGQDSSRALIALVLGFAGMFCFGPLASVPGAFLAWMEMNACKARGEKASTMALVALGLNAVVTVFGLFGCMALGLMTLMPLMAY